MIYIASYALLGLLIFVARRAKQIVDTNFELERKYNSLLGRYHGLERVKDNYVATIREAERTCGLLLEQRDAQDKEIERLKSNLEASEQCLRGEYPESSCSKCGELIVNRYGKILTGGYVGFTKGPKTCLKCE